MASRFDISSSTTSRVVSALKAVFLGRSGDGLRAGSDGPWNVMLCTPG
jgi:hypothetical protein